MCNIEKIIKIESRNKRSAHTQAYNSMFKNNPKAQLKEKFQRNFNSK